MAKKSALKVVTPQRTSAAHKTAPLVERRSEMSGGTSDTSSAWAQTVVGEASQVFSSEEQALSFLVDSVTGKLGDSEVERTQMHEFLNLLLDTDPTLREEILAAVTIRK